MRLYSMNVSAINLTNQKNFGQSGVEQLVKVANTVSDAKELNADTIKQVADCIEISNDTPKNTRILKHFLVSLVGAIATFSAVKAASGRVFNYVDTKLNVPVFDYIGTYSKKAYDKLRNRVVPQTARTFKAMVNNGLDNVLNWSRDFAHKSVSADALEKFKKASPNGNVAEFYAKKAAMKGLSMVTGALAAMKSLGITTRDADGNGTPDIFDESDSPAKTTKGTDLVDVAVKAANLLPG